MPQGTKMRALSRALHQRSRRLKRSNRTGRERNRHRRQQPLPRDAGLEPILPESFVEHALMRRVLVHDEQAALCLRQEVARAQLSENSE